VYLNSRGRCFGSGPFPPVAFEVGALVVPAVVFAPGMGFCGALLII